MNLPEYLLNAKICNKDTCEEIRTLKKENQRLNNVLNELERRIEKTKSEIDDLLIYDDFSDVTKGFGNVPEQLKFYLSKYEHIEEFRLNELKESDK